MGSAAGGGAGGAAAVAAVTLAPEREEFNDFNYWRVQPPIIIGESWGESWGEPWGEQEMHCHESAFVGG